MSLARALPLLGHALPPLGVASLGLGGAEMRDQHPADPSSVQQAPVDGVRDQGEHGADQRSEDLADAQQGLRPARAPGR